MSNLSPHALVVKRATIDLPINRYSLPEGLYRTDLFAGVLDFDAMSEDELQDAYMPIEYAEGFPTSSEGCPIWEQLPFEPDDSYDLFQRYLEQGNIGVRQAQKLDSSEVHNYYVMYYWDVRSRAYDMFQEVCLRRRRALKQLEVEDDHFEIAACIIEKIKVYLNDDDGEFLELLTPKAAGDILRMATQLQRVSIGLPPSGPIATGEEARTPIEVTLRQIAKRVGHVEEREAGMSKDIRDRLLQDPDTALAAQELIIRVGQ